MASEFAEEGVPYSMELLELESSLPSFEYLLEFLQEFDWFKIDVKVTDEYHQLKIIIGLVPSGQLFWKINVG